MMVVRILLLLLAGALGIAASTESKMALTSLRHFILCYRACEVAEGRIKGIAHGGHAQL